jgi:3-hydroxyisobutyrate dehydrogenase-like beta-hydroxyacid dehydrogenase
MVGVIGRSTGNSVAFQYTAPRVVSRDFDGIRMDITYKDLELQTALAKSMNVPLFLATICQQIYQMGRAAGLGGEDGAAIVKIYEQMTGVRRLLLDCNRLARISQTGRCIGALDLRKSS